MNDQELIPVVCSYPKCEEWAVSYTTLEDNPQPWPVRILEGIWNEFLRESVQTPIWYACQVHRTPKHKTLPFEGEPPPVCEYCGSTDGVRWSNCNTRYHIEATAWDYVRYGPGGPPDPNRERPYCAECFEEDEHFWAEQWKEYRSMQGV